MRCGLTRTIAPAQQLVTVAQVQAQSRLDTDYTGDTDLISTYIDVATEHCEQDCGRSFLTQTWLYSVSKFDHHIHIPQWVGATIPYYWDLAPQKRILYLPRPPLQSVTPVNYFDENGNWQTLDPSQYVVDTTGMFGSIRPVVNGQWPRTQMDNPAAVQVTFVAGYGDSPASTPACVRMATLMCAAYLYEFREPVVTGTIVSSMPMGVREMLDPIRVLEA
jgi:uncharacterized phiE125 gp8 family phage protein